LGLGKLLLSFITILDLSTPDESGGYSHVCPTDNFLVAQQWLFRNSWIRNTRPRTSWTRNSDLFL